MVSDVIATMRLTSGEEIIGSIILETDQYYKVENPLVIKQIYYTGSVTPHMSLSRWIPYIKTNEAEIKKIHVITLVEPDDNMKIYYDQVIDYIDQVIDPYLQEHIVESIKKNEEGKEEWTKKNESGSEKDRALKEFLNETFNKPKSNTGLN